MSVYSKNMSWSHRCSDGGPLILSDSCIEWWLCHLIELNFKHRPPAGGVGGTGDHSNWRFMSFFIFVKLLLIHSWISYRKLERAPTETKGMPSLAQRALDAKKSMVKIKISTYLIRHINIPKDVTTNYQNNSYPKKNEKTP